MTIKTLHQPQYYCIARNQYGAYYAPCMVVARENDKRHQYRVATLDTGEELLVSDLLTSFEITAEYFANTYADDLAHLVFASTFSPHQSYACFLALDSDPREFTIQQLSLLSERGYGAALRHRAQQELDARQEADAERYTCPLCEEGVRVGSHAIPCASWDGIPDYTCEPDPCAAWNDEVPF